ncbi:MAG: adenosylmethionine--8-amino-7-oxononanoate transaminase [Pseudomonadota bacterium]
MTDRTNSLREKDKRYLWHPFTQMHDWLADDPLVIESASGNYLIDTDGNRYFDGVSSLWVTVHGHCHPKINLAIRTQLERLDHSTLLGLANVPSIELAERLVRLAPPGLSRVFYSDSGSTAVEIAVKMAYQYWTQKGQPQRRKYVALADAYHGDTLGAVSVGGVELFHQTFKPLLFQVLRAPTPYWYRCPETTDPVGCRDRCLNALDQLLTEHGSEVAAFVVEPLVQGAAGMITHPRGFLSAAADLCRRHQVLLICDEVATGFGRTGTMFACNQEEVTPDLLCLAKGLTGGYLPLAATLTTDAIFQGFLGRYTDQKTFFHGHTYTGNPLACAAALASLDLFAQERVIERLGPKIAMLTQKLATRIEPLAHVGQVRQCGMMVGIELVRKRATKEAYPFEAAIGARVCRAVRRHGVILRPLGTVVVLLPPLSITEPEIDLLVESTRAAIIEETEDERPQTGTAPGPRTESSAVNSLRSTADSTRKASGKD